MSSLCDIMKDDIMSTLMLFFDGVLFCINFEMWIKLHTDQDQCQ